MKRRKSNSKYIDYAQPFVDYRYKEPRDARYRRTGKGEVFSLTVVIIEVAYPELKHRGKEVYERKFFGVTMTELLKKSCDEFPVRIWHMKKPEAREERELIFRRLHKIKTTHTLILRTDTPLVEKIDIKLLIKRFREAKYNIVFLPHGYLCESDFFEKHMHEFGPRVRPTYTVATYIKDQTSFFWVHDYNTLNIYKNTLHEHIVKEHKGNGVQILDEASTYIDATVTINTGAVIYPNNVITGKSHISAKATLWPYNHIHNSNINAKAEINGSHIINSFVDTGAKVSGAYVENAEIGPGEVVKPFTHIEGEAPVTKDFEEEMFSSNHDE